MEHTTTFPASPDELWEVVTSPEGVDAWLGDGSDLAPLEGAELDVADVETGVRRHGRVETVEPGRRLGFVWWPADGDEGHDASRVDIALVPDGDHTHLVVTEIPVGATGHVTASIATGTAWPWRTAGLELRCSALAYA